MGEINDITGYPDMEALHTCILQTGIQSTLLDWRVNGMSQLKCGELN